MNYQYLLISLNLVSFARIALQNVFSSLATTVCFIFSVDQRRPQQENIFDRFWKDRTQYLMSIPTNTQLELRLDL